MVALDADTGKLKWFYQFTPHDEMDYDSTQVPVLADIHWKGQPRKVMLWANRNGFFYVLDRNTGEFLLGKPFTTVNWIPASTKKAVPCALRAKSLRPKAAPSCRPCSAARTGIRLPSARPPGCSIFPLWENTGSFQVRAVSVRRGSSSADPIPWRRQSRTPTEARSRRHRRGSRHRPAHRRQKWEFKMADITWAGVLTTASDLLFSGGREGYFFALNAKTGNLLWKASLGGQVNCAPMS